MKTHFKFRSAVGVLGDSLMRRNLTRAFLHDNIGPLYLAICWELTTRPPDSPISRARYDYLVGPDYHDGDEDRSEARRKWMRSKQALRRCPARCSAAAAASGVPPVTVG